MAKNPRWSLMVGVLLLLGASLLAKELPVEREQVVVSALEAAASAWVKGDWLSLEQRISQDAFVFIEPPTIRSDFAALSDKRACLDLARLTWAKCRPSSCVVRLRQLRFWDAVAIAYVSVAHRADAFGEEQFPLVVVVHVTRRGPRVVLVVPGFFEPCVEVLEVLPGTEAAAKGFQAGDILVSYDGQAVAQAESFAATVKRSSGKQEHEVVLLRGATRMNVAVRGGRLGLQIQDAVLPSAQPEGALQANSGLGELVKGVQEAIGAADAARFIGYFSERAFVWVGEVSRFGRESLRVMDGDHVKKSYASQWASRAGKSSAKRVRFPEYRAIDGGGVALLDVQVEARTAGGRQVSRPLIAVVARSEDEGQKIVAILPAWFRVAGPAIPLCSASSGPALGQQ